MRPLKIYTSAPRDHTASYYYRLLGPLRTMHDVGLPIQVMVDSDSTRITPQEKAAAFCECDVALIYQPVGNQPLNDVRSVQRFVPSLVDNEWKWPPTVIIETDDNIFNVNPLNPAFGNLGVRDHNGTDIPPGHHIGVVQNGEKVVRWIDGHTCDGTCGPNGAGNCGKGLNIRRNRELLNAYRTMLSVADAVQVSTPPLEKVIYKESNPQRVRVFPNLVRFDDYEQVDLAPRPKQVRILWQGGQNHYEDWFSLRDSVGRITRKYPEVHWVFWGVLYPWAVHEIPPDRYTFLNWSPYQEYKLRLAMIGHDINLAPLGSNIFNDCRSAIKWYESSVLRKPAVTLAENTGAYKAEMQEAETGLLFNGPEEFEDKLAALIEQPDERTRMARNAKQWLSENRDAAKCVPDIYKFWLELREERKREQPHVTLADWEELRKQAEAEQQAEMAMNGAGG